MRIRTHEDLRVYQLAYKLAMEIFEKTKSYPTVERYSLIDQMRRSSRSICANIAEAFRVRRYPNHFISKMSISECEAAETQVWVKFSHDCGYIDKSEFDYLFSQYNNVLGMLVNMIRDSERWCIKPEKVETRDENKFDF
ncbi:four helix bundle protein [bacterium]|nr:four helix bundle protein [bacterium]